MRRVLIFLIVLLVLSAVLVAPAANADEWSEALRAYREDIKPGNPVSQRLRAVRTLSTFGTKEAARILLGTVAETERTEKPLLEEKEDVEDRIQKILGPQQFEPKRTLDSRVIPGLRELQRKLDSLQQKVVAEARIRQEITKALGTFDDAGARTFLMRDALRDRSLRVREIAAASLGELRDKAAIKPLRKALSDRALSVREAVLTSLGQLEAVEALPDILKALEDKAWQIRAAAVRALRLLAVKEAVGPLIEALSREEGRLQKDVADALEDLTGQRFGTSIQSWRKWWEEHKHEYGGDGGAAIGGHGRGKTRGVSYYGITTHSRRIVYVLDVSGSMSRAHAAPGREAEAGETIKVDAAKRELIRSLKSIPSKGAFTIIVYNDLIKVWQPKLVSASSGNKTTAETFVNALNAASSTNIYGALEAVFKLQGMGASDRHYDIAADTVFLLTDGSPTKPDGTMDSTEKIIVACREWNRLKRVTIHTIGIGKQHNGGFLRQLARENGGQYVAR